MQDKQGGRPQGIQGNVDSTLEKSDGGDVGAAGSDQGEQLTAKRNKDNFTSGETTDDTNGSSLPDNDVPESSKITVLPKSSNSANIEINGFTLKPSQPITFDLSNTNLIDITANSSGDGVEWGFEDDN